MRGVPMRDRSDKTCVFVGCRNEQTKHGACDSHQDMAAAVMRGDSVTCAHGITIDKDCRDCELGQAKRRLSDANVVQVACDGKLDDEMKAIDVKLRELHRELLRRGFDSKLGPHGGAPIATHIGLPMPDGRVYAIRFQENRFVVYWGTVEVIAASESDAIVMFFVGLHEREGR